MDFDFNIRRRPAKLAVIPVAADENNDAQFSEIDSDKVSDSTPSSYKEFLDKNNLEDLDDPAESKKGSGGNSEHAKDSDNKPNLFKRLIAWIRTHQQLSIIIGSVVVLLIAGGVTFALTRPAKVANQASAKHTVKPKLTPPASPTSPLTGIDVSADQAKRPVTGMMIENTVFARPQSGLRDAGVIYEAIAEAGITRFLALYQETRPGNIGPIRSSRPYYVDWAHSFDASYGHVGGSPDALTKIKADGVKDLDQFANAGYYHRVSSREAPHNVYTNFDDIDRANKDKGWSSSTFTSWPRKKDARPKTPAAVTARSIDISISAPTYNSHYDYVPDTNTYNRSEGGAAHVDAESGQPLSPKVVIALVIPYSIESDGYHSHYEITGTGAMTVFQDGVATRGTWNRPGPADQYVFSDEAGHPLKLNTGQTWITAVAGADAISFAP